MCLNFQEIYALGGRTFLVFNLAPIGCYPAYLVELPHNSSDIDSFGCMISYNKAVVDYNTMLKEALRKTRIEIPDAHVIYADIHSVMLHLFQHLLMVYIYNIQDFQLCSTYLNARCKGSCFLTLGDWTGMKYGTKACCGYGGGAYNFDTKLYCGITETINGRNLTAKTCVDPYNYVSWDGIHATEAANKIVAYAILNSSIFDPPFSFHKVCDT